METTTHMAVELKLTEMRIKQNWNKAIALERGTYNIQIVALNVSFYVVIIHAPDKHKMRLTFTMIARMLWVLHAILFKAIQFVIVLKLFIKYFRPVDSQLFLHGRQVIDSTFTAVTEIRCVVIQVRRSRIMWVSGEFLIFFRQNVFNCFVTIK